MCIKHPFSVRPFAAMILLTTMLIHAESTRWDEFAEFAKIFQAIAPTPTGDGHLGQLASGRAVQLRFPVPDQEIGGYWLLLGNVVGYSGRGVKYQLVLHRDSADGAIVHQGPVCENGDDWNVSNRRPVDITDHLTPADRKRGYLDIWVTAKVAEDTWTVYRHHPEKRPILARIALLTPEMHARRAAEKALRRAGLSLIPQPNSILVRSAPPLKLPPGSTIHSLKPQSKDFAFAAGEIRSLVLERTGLELRVTSDMKETGETARISLRLAREAERAKTAELRNPEGYVLRVDARGAEVVGGGLSGVFYGAMTLAQMLRVRDGALTAPACEVRDAPAFRLRIIQYDIARGQTVDVAYVKRLIRELARCKTNAMLFYMEDDFKFRQYPFLGREGTFTHAKARELSDYAHRYHMQLIPQFESLGHAGAVLRHPEMESMREAGGSWVFCTREPRTWEFLDHVFGELAEAFPYSEFIHVGGDEFETGFGKCPNCRKVIANEGMGGLYAEHMNRLNRLVKKQGRRMLFWTSHHGPTADLSRMTLQNAARLDKDMIPTEWIYHGPAVYPTIEEYQKLGFQDVFCSPAVVDYSRVWPDYRTTFRGIRGFYRWGADRHCGGAYCTTWEFMRGALVENSVFGLLYASECGWNPRSTSRQDFGRRFGAYWWGLDATAATRISDTLFAPLPDAKGDGRVWQNGREATKVLWIKPTNVLRGWSMRTSQAREKAEVLERAMTVALARVQQTGATTKRHPLTLSAAKLGFGMMHYAAEKTLAMQWAAEHYRQAEESLPGDAGISGQTLRRIAERMRQLGTRVDGLADEYASFVAHCGAYKGDADALRRQAEDLRTLQHTIEKLQSRIAAGELRQLPPGRQLGLPSGRYVRLGIWSPKTVSEKGATPRFRLDAAALTAKTRAVEVEWAYTRGPHGLSISATRLLCNGKVVAEDRHEGWAGSGSRNNVYQLPLQHLVPNAVYEIVGEVKSRGGANSNGEVWLMLP